MLKVALRSIALCVACALSSVALAEERVQHLALEQAGVFADAGVRPLELEKLDELRGRLPAPTTLQQVGVVLWDEPRKGLPPQRGSNNEAPPVGVNGTFGVNIHR